MSKNSIYTTDYGPNHAYEIINADGDADIVFICEHARKYIPPEYDNLGLDKNFLDEHIAWDIGMEELTRELAIRLNAPAIIATFSRLLIDPNREEDHKTLIPPESDNIIIPGNQNLSDQEIGKRLNLFHRTFHDRTDQLITRKISENHAPLVCGMHSFTPRMNGFDRPWEIGLLWNKDPRLAKALIETMTERNFTVGDNEPYSGRDLFHTMNIHGGRHGVPHATIEIRQNEVGNKNGIKNWADILSEDLTKIAQNEKIRNIEYY